jgi:hypothetical protein
MIDLTLLITDSIPWLYWENSLIIVEPSMIIDLPSLTISLTL